MDAILLLFVGYTSQSQRLRQGCGWIILFWIMYLCAIFSMNMLEILAQWMFTAMRRKATQCNFNFKQFRTHFNCIFQFTFLLLCSVPRKVAGHPCWVCFTTSLNLFPLAMKQASVDVRASKCKPSSRRYDIPKTGIFCPQDSSARRLFLHWNICAFHLNLSSSSCLKHVPCVRHAYVCVHALLDVCEQ